MLEHFKTYLRSKRFRLDSSFEQDGIKYTVTKEGDGDRPPEVEVAGADPDLVTVDIPDRAEECPVTSIGRNALKNHPSVRSVRIGSGVRRIGEGSFSGAPCLRNVSLPVDLEIIGSEAFSDCALLGSMVMPPCVKSIGARAFRNCRKLDDVSLPASLLRIDAGTFENCTSLKDITLIGKVESIGERAFSNCSGLSEVALPASLVSIDSKAFENCVSLKRIGIPGNVRSIAMDAFTGCTGLESFVADPHSMDFCTDAQGILYNRGRTRLLLCPPAVVRDAEIPDSVTVIGAGAFSGYRRERIRIPDSVTSAEEGAFDCAFLSGPDGGTLDDSELHGYDYVYRSDLRAFVRDRLTEDGFVCELIGEDRFGRPVYGVTGYEGTDDSPALPDTWNGHAVSAICDSAFCNNRELKNLVIPEGYTSLGRSLFMGCASLRSVTLPKSIDEVPENAFRDCDLLRTVVLHGGVKEIGVSAFQRCRSLESFEIPMGVTVIRGSVFKDCPALKDVTLHDGIRAIEAEAFLRCSSLDELKMPSGLESIDASAFGRRFCQRGGRELETAEELAGRGFAFDDAVGCYVLSDGSECEDAPEETTAAPAGDFDDLGFLDEEPEELEDDEGFVYTLRESEGTETLTLTDYRGSASEVRIPSEYKGCPVTEIEDEAFAMSEGLESVIIPEGITRIGGGAFSGCGKLARISFPRTLETIEDYAFEHGFFDAEGRELTSVHDLGGLTFVMDPEGTAFIVLSEPSAAPAEDFDGIDLPDEELKDNEGFVYTLRKRGGTATLSLTDYIGSASEVRIPSEYKGYPVTVIGCEAFFDCDRIGSVIIPEGVAEIGCEAFLQCYSIVRISFPGTLKTVGDEAFDLDFHDRKGKKLMKVSELRGLTFVKNPEGTAFIASSEPSAVPASESDDRLIGTSMEEVEDDEGFVYTAWSEGDAATLTLTGYNGSASEVRIPSEYKGYPVTEIDDGAFVLSDSMESVIIPEGVVKIGNYFFPDCNNIVRISFPSTLEHIEDETFDCVFCDRSGSPLIYGSELAGRTFVKDPDAPVYIAADEGDPEYADVPDAEPGEMRDDYGFVYTLRETGGTETLTLKSYGGLASEVRIPSEYGGHPVTEIGDEAFVRGCFESIIIPEGITGIGDDAFAECRRFECISFPCTLKTVGSEAFELDFCDRKGKKLIWVSELRGLTFMKNAEGTAFIALSEPSAVPAEHSDDDELISTSIEEVEDDEGFVYTAWGTGKTATLTLTDYMGTSSDIRIPSEYKGCPVTEIGDDAFRYCDWLESVIIPEGITGIGDGAFRTCVAITRMSFPSTLERIGYDAFECIFSDKDRKLLTKAHELKGRTFVINYCNTVLIVAAEGDPLDGRGRIIAPGELEDDEGFVYTVCMPEGSFVLTLTDCNDPPHEMCIPSEYGGYPVTEIGESVLYGCGSVEKVIIPENVTKIGDMAFRWCSNLVSVTFPSSLESIGDEAFDYGFCDAEGKELTSADELRDRTFVLNRHKTAFIPALPAWDPASADDSGSDDDLGPIDEIEGEDGFVYFLFNTEGTETLTVTRYKGTSADVHVPSEYGGRPVTEIGDWAFINHEGIRSVTLPEGVVSIMDEAFHGCEDLVRISFPATLYWVDKHAFDFCFYDRDGKELTDESELAGRTFVKDPHGTGFVPFAPEPASEKETVPFTEHSPGDTVSADGFMYRFAEGPDGEIVATLRKYRGMDEAATVPGTVDGYRITSVAANSFYGCPTLKEVTIGENVTSVGRYAFRSCTSLERVTLPSGLQSLGDSAFYGCTALEHVTFPERLEEIRTCTFGKCASLVSVDLPDSIATIDVMAFSGCGALCRIRMPRSLVRIHSNSFDRRFCTGDGARTMNADEMAGCTFVLDPESGDYVCESARTEERKEEEPSGSAGHPTAGGLIELGGLTFIIVSIPERGRPGTVAVKKCDGTSEDVRIPASAEGFDVTGICDEAFTDCDAIRHAVLPENIVSIGDNAFTGCESLESVELPDSLRSLGDRTFSCCTSLRGIVIPEGTERLGEYVFAGCSSLRTARIPGTLRQLSEGTFAQCGSLEKVSIPEGMKMIGGTAFMDCESLASAELPEGLTEIGEMAFAGCDRLARITIPSTLEKMGFNAFGRVFLSREGDALHDGKDMAGRTFASDDKGQVFEEEP